MGWHFKWVSSFGSDFNFDYHVSFTEEDKARGKVFYNFETIDYASDELPGFSVFTKDEAGQIFHTYSVFSRGTDQLGSTYGFLDLTPKGRNEPPGGNLTALGPPPRQIRGKTRRFLLPRLGRMGVSSGRAEEKPMPALSLDHWNVYCKDLKATVDFYEKYVGLYAGDRPPFNFPGAWLYAGEKAILHLVSETGRKDHGGGAIDHVAINCADIRGTIDQHQEGQGAFEVRRSRRGRCSRFSCTIPTAS